MTTSPILSYSVAPSSADITPAGGPTSTIASLQITIANNNPDGTTYTVDSIVFQIPVGADTTDLTPSDDVGSITTTAPTGWSLAYQGTSSGFASWLLEPTTASGSLGDGTELVVSLDKVTINGAAGAAQIWVTETIDGSTGQPGTPPGLIIDKVQPQPELLAFSVNQALVLVGQQPVLSWQSQGVTQCTLQCSNPGEEPTVPANSPVGGYRAPAVTAVGVATYVLTGYANGTVLAQTLATSVQVIELSITSFTATPGAAGTLTLAWTTEHATGVTLTLTGIGTTPPVAVLGAGPANCSGATLSGLSPAWAGTLTLTAGNTATTATATQSIGISDSACTVASSTPDNGLFDNNRSAGGNNLCLSPDGTELVGWIIQEIKDDGGLRSQTQAAVSSDWGSTWTFTDMTASMSDLPFQITSNSSAYYGLVPPHPDRSDWMIANATTPTDWHGHVTSGFPSQLGLPSGSLFAFQNQAWLRMLSDSDGSLQMSIFRLGSENEWAMTSSLSEVGSVGVVNGTMMVATASTLASSIDGNTWTVERDGFPWVGSQRTPIAPPVSSNGCLWFVTRAIDETGTLYCRDTAGIWHTFPFTSPPSYPRAENCFAVVGGGSLQIYPPGNYNTPLELTLTSKPTLTLPHS